MPPIIDDDGINLVPVMTKTEVVVEKKKSIFNIGAVVSIVVFLLITIFVVAFSTISKIQLNNEKESLFTLENEIKGLSTKILNNQEVLRRVYLYRDISSSQFSARKVFDYFSAIAAKQGNVTLKSFVFGSETQHSFEGSADSLDTASKLWYLLKTDELVDSVNMDNLSKNNEGVDFSFKVALIEDAFKEDENNLENQTNEELVIDEEDPNYEWETYEEDIILETEEEI